MLEYDWLLTALIYGLIGSPITCICNGTGQIEQLSSQ